MKTYLILFFACFLLGSNVYGQTLNTQKLDSLFNNLSAKNVEVGSVAISKNGKVIYNRSFGGIPGDSSQQTVKGGDGEYRIGSITKMFTAVLIFQLIEEKKLSLNDTLSKYFPQIPNSRKITIGNMLSHRSGLANYTNNTNFDDWKDKPKTHEELLAMLINQKPNFEPGAKAEYCNSNYLLLGYILEKIYKKPYKDIVTERIINKLGLSKTYYGEHAGFINNEAASYHYFDYKWKKDKAVYLDDFAGAGAIISTSADMTKFITAEFSYKLVKKESLDQMKTMIEGYGMGLFPYGSAQHPGFGHNGKTEGFGSSLSYYPENGLAIAYVINGEVYPRALMLDDIFAICFNLPCTIPAFNPIAVSGSVLDKYTGTYVSAQMGMKVVCSSNGKNLMLETRGQAFKVDALTENEFLCPQYGFFFYFNNDGKKMTIRDADDIYELDKQ